MKKISTLALGIALSLGLAACSSEPKTEVAAVSGIELQNFDASVRHQDDFYYSVNGKWLANTPIPADKSNYGAFSVLYDQSQDALKKIIDAAAAKKNAAPGSNEQKIGDFNASFMNTDLLETLGVTPLNPLLADISAVKNHSELPAVMGKLLTSGSGIPFGFYVNNDAKNSTQYAVYLSQSGLTLPDRDYYLKDDAKFVANRQAMAKYVTDILTEAGYKNAKRAAKNVADIEMMIAKSQWSRVESRDANKSYNKLNRAELQKLMGQFDFNAFAANAGLGDKVADVIVRQPSYFEKLGANFDAFPVSAWQDYLTFHLVDSYAELLSKNFVDLNFAFKSKTLMGIEEQQPRWKKAVDGADTVIGELVGEEYVKQYFKPEAKARMETMIKNLIKGFEVSINELEWMTPETKVAAQEKLAKFTYKIGYPDKWRDYSNVRIARNTYFENMVSASAAAYQFQLAKLDKPVDKSQWYTTTPTVTAYNNPTANEIVFPAGILQPPYFDNNADDALNYGGIGMVIGHEITHTFDDQGAQFDKVGNLKDWWTKEDYAQFKSRIQQVINLYNTYAVLGDLHINGAMTVGENTADIAGIAVAYDAFKMTKEGQGNTKIDGFTPDQRFFISIAKIWRVKMKDEFLRLWINNNPHSPPNWRVNGPLMNTTPFYDAFNVQPGDKMFLPKKDRITIW